MKTSAKLMALSGRNTKLFSETSSAFFAVLYALWYAIVAGCKNSVILNDDCAYAAP